MTDIPPWPTRPPPDDHEDDEPPDEAAFCLCIALLFGVNLHYLISCYIQGLFID